MTQVLVLGHPQLLQPLLLRPVPALASPTPAAGGRACGRRLNAAHHGPALPWRRPLHVRAWATGLHVQRGRQGGGLQPLHGPLVLLEAASFLFVGGKSVYTRAGF